MAGAAHLCRAPPEGGFGRQLQGILPRRPLCGPGHLPVPHLRPRRTPVESCEARTESKTSRQEAGGLRRACARLHSEKEATPKFIETLGKCSHNLAGHNGAGGQVARDPQRACGGFLTKGSVAG
jgi:hypothetical protein